MRIAIYCRDCIADVKTNYMPAYMELRDDGVYETTCPFGHKSVHILQPQRFEVLSELAVSAIVDGYYREAVANFTSSMERFFEFFIRVKLNSTGVAKESVENFWKEISSQSERQLGAFLSAYTDAFGMPPQLLHKKKVELRNAVIHKGRIPSRDQAIEYGQAVIDVMRPIKWCMKDSFEESVQALTTQYLYELTSNPDLPRTTTWVSTLFSLVESRDQEVTLIEAIAKRIQL